RACNSHAALVAALKETTEALAVMHQRYDPDYGPREAFLVRLRNLLAIPDDYAIACWLALGYPDEEDSGRIVQHFPDIRDRIRTNGWFAG
ncbi:MAG: hypothetical protein UY48_C0034G0011, partial [Candidatus Gottesmanbacteria bacterium GW2011_GWB1_49_7]